MTTNNVLGFGTGGGETTNDAAAIQKTIEPCTASRGGTVLFAAGRSYLSGVFMLRPNIELQIERGATSLASNRVEDYPPEL